MKICIIGVPRSRSSMLLETISAYYNIEIIGDEINKIKDKQGLIYIDKIRPWLDTYSSLTSGVVRFHPLQFLTEPPLTVINFDFFSFDQYDKIFFTERESVSENIASNFVATKLKTFTYRSRHEVFWKVGPYTFTPDDHFHIRDYYRNSYIVEKLKQYLDRNSISWISIDYIKVPSFIEETFPNIWVSHVETKYQYKTIVTNYDDIIEIYNKGNLYDQF